MDQGVEAYYWGENSCLVPKALDYATFLEPSTLCLLAGGPGVKSLIRSKVRNRLFIIR